MTESNSIEPIEKLFEKLKVDAVFGEPIKEGDVTLIPVADVGVGFGFGSGQNPAAQEEAGEAGSGQGMGLWEAPRGALGHWIDISGGKIRNYQCVVPTTWNCSPKDAQGQSGPVEQALIGTVINDIENPFGIGRIVRGFVPCLACAVHLITPKGKELGRYRIV